MTTMNDIRNMKDDEVADLVREKREEVRASRFNLASRDVRKIRTARRDVARGLMELAKRQSTPSA